MAFSGIKQCLHNVTGYLVLLVLISQLGPLMFGYHLGELNAPKAVITCQKTSAGSAFSLIKSKLEPKPSVSGLTKLPSCISMDEAQFALISSIFTLGGLLGALSAGPISTKYGRLPCMRILTIFFILGSILESVAGNIGTMVTGRLLSGVGAGASLVVVPIYISEIAPPQERGLFGVMTQISINTGLLLTQILGYYLSTRDGWRIILGVAGIIGVISLLALLLIPESPAWMAANKNTQAAVRTLQRIRGRGVDISSETSGWEGISSMTPESEGLLVHDSRSRRSSATSRSSTSSSASKKHVGILQVVKDPLYRPAILAVVICMAAQQFTGINSVMMYSVTVLSTLFPSSATLLTIFLSLINFLLTILFAPLADTLGRRRSLLLSITGMGSSSALLFFSLYYSLSTLSAISIMLFVASFAAGLGPIPFILASELVGTEARGASQSWALASSWISTFLVAQFFPLINEALGGKGWVYAVFAVAAVVFGIAVFTFVPETKGKESVEEVWGRERRVD